MSQINSIENSEELKITSTIKGSDTNEIKSLCTLKNGRLVSCGERIIIYKEVSYKADVVIEKAHGDYSIWSVCGLTDGNLVSCGGDGDLKIWLIDENIYKILHTLKGHTGIVHKAIELEDGKICSCSFDYSLKIWDNKNNYQCIQTLAEHCSAVLSVLEMNEYIISAGEYDDNSVIIWNKSTYESPEVIEGVYCCSNNGLAKLKDNKVIVGGYNQIFIVDALSSQYQTFDEEIESIWCLYVMENGKVLLGNETGNIICFDTLSEQIVFTKKVHDGGITCLIDSKEKKLISSSSDNTINVYS